MEQVEADSVRLAMQGVDSPAYPAVIRIQKFYEEHPDRLPPTGEASRLLSLLKQLFQPEEAETGRLRTNSLRTMSAASPQIDTEVSATALESCAVARASVPDIKDNPAFGDGMYIDDGSWPPNPVHVADIDGLRFSDLSTETTALSSWLGTYSPQFVDSAILGTGKYKGFIYDGEFYYIEEVGGVRYVRRADDDDYSYDADTGVISFYDTDLYAGFDRANGNPFYSLKVTPDPASGALTIENYPPGAAVYTADGSYLFTLPSGAAYTLNISMEDFIAICLAGGLYIDDGSSNGSFAIISPGQLVNAFPAAEKFTLDIYDNVNSRLAAQYSGVLSAREIKHTSLALSTPKVFFGGADVSYLFAPNIEYLGEGKGKVRYVNGLLFGAGEVIIKTSHWELDEEGNPRRIDKEIREYFPEEADYIANDRVDLPSGLNLNYKLLPADLDRAPRGQSGAGRAGYRFAGLS
jgi:hypothetical protein